MFHFVPCLTLLSELLYFGCAFLDVKSTHCFLKGLAELSKRSYRSAARLFLEASFDHADFSEVRCTVV